MNRPDRKLLSKSTEKKDGSSPAELAKRELRPKTVKITTEWTALGLIWRHPDPNNLLCLSGPVQWCYDIAVPSNEYRNVSRAPPWIISQQSHMLVSIGWIGSVRRPASISQLARASDNFTQMCLQTLCWHMKFSPLRHVWRKACLSGGWTARTANSFPIAQRRKKCSSNEVLSKDS